MADKIFQNKLGESLNKFHDKIAIEHNSRFLSYAELDKRSNHIAQWIVNKGIEKETFIGILMDDKMNLVVTMIGILKAGCVFIPLDTGLPANRIRVMISSTDTKFVITDRGIGFNDFLVGTGDAHEKQNHGVEFFLMENIFPGEGASLFLNPPAVQYRPGDKIYVYFTSGSTGTPKAIVGKNESLFHFIDWEITTFEIDETFRFSQFTNPGFDAYLRDTFVPLCSGGRVCIPGNDEIMLDSEELVKWIDQTGINVIHCVPSFFRQISAGNLTAEHFKALKFILMSGEKISPHRLVDWYAVFGERIQLVNFYGPTETTMIKTYYFIRESDTKKERIPVGKPMKGARVIVLNKNMKKCKPMVVGDIYIRTPYRTFGYYNEPALNKERFISNPFGNDPNDLIHKTGDLGRLLPDGNLEILGRIDRQVKIRGIRVELEEIETVLSTHPAVEEAVAVKVDLNPHNELLCAYITRNGYNSDSKEIWLADVKEYISGQLPDFMVPAKIMKMDKIPRNPTGKVDYNQLPDPLKDDSNYIPPRDEVESKLAGLWSEVLGVPKEEIGISHHFFEMGGNSLNVLRVRNEIHKEFNILIPMEKIFDSPTIERQAEFIRGAKEEKYAAIEPIEKKEYYALSSAQRRMYILQQMEPLNLSYNIQVTLLLEGHMDKKRMEETFGKLIQRHENFRTSFEMVGPEPVQRIYSTVPFAIAYFQSSEEEADKIVHGFIKPFDLGQAPLLRVGLIQIGEALHILMVDLHHIISDGISIEILQRDFGILSAGGDLPPLKLQYNDYSQWENSEKQQKLIRQQEMYWLKEFPGEVPVLNLPTDYPRPEVQDFEGDRVYFNAGEEKVLQLKALARREEVTVYMLCLAIFTVLLHKITGQEDTIVGLDNAGRGHADLQNVIGMFVNTLALRNYPTPAKTFTEFLEETKQRTLKAFENQDYQFDRLVEQVVVNRDLSRNPLFDVAFYFFNTNMILDNIPKTNPKNARPGLVQIPYRRKQKESKFDLTLLISESRDGNKLFFVFEYCTKLFKKEKIETFAIFFEEILSEVLENPWVTLGEIEISLHLLARKEEAIRLEELVFD